MTKIMGRAAIAGALVGGVWWFLGMPGLPRTAKFTDQDIKDVKSSITTEFEKREGVKVSSVEMLKKSDVDLRGYVKLNALDEDGNVIEFTHECHAEIYQNDQKYLWSCN